MKRFLIVAALAATATWSQAQAQAQAQAPTQPPAQATLHARTASELAELCGTKPTDPASAARLNFCFGYGQATLDAATKQAAGRKSYCIPSPSPTRQATMAEFAGWVRATPSIAGGNSQEALAKFMSQRFPCKT